jgi:NADP-dependent 3-hydroxy acid dehydrogenase YdfG
MSGGGYATIRECEAARGVSQGIVVRMTLLRDRVALVTGASSGIGTATARALSAAGARVLLAARRTERLQALAAELPGSIPLQVDVRDWNELAKAVEPHRVDIVVANAGLARGVASVQEGDPEDWSVVIDTNVKGVLHTVRATLPGMIAAGRGDVVLLGSVAGRQAYPGGNVYNASKFAVRGLYEALRLDVAGAGVRVSTVDPGLVETEFARVRLDGDEERAAQVYQGLRVLTPEDVADAILFVLTRPAHVNIGELVLWPTDQASTTVVHRRSHESSRPGADRG